MTRADHAAHVRTAESAAAFVSRRVGPVTRGGSRGRYDIALASEADDAALRALMRSIPMTGSIELTLRREPRFFDAATVEGSFHQVLIARERSTRRIVGVGSRSVRQRWIDGRPQPVGYLSGLRLLPEARHRTLLVRGYRELARLHGDGRTGFYLSTIAEGNQRALSALVGARAGLPSYHDLGRYLTFVLPVHRRVAVRPDSGMQVRPLGRHEVPQFVEFLNASGRDRLFFPCLVGDDFGSAAGTFRDLALDDVLCAWRGGELAGTLAAWDQSSFRQTVVERYSGAMRWWRPAYNMLAFARGWPRFPAPGSRLPNLTLALPVADGPTFLQLLAGLQQRHQASAADSLLLGLFERDPLVEIVRPLALHTYVTRVFVVTWDPATVKPERFNGRNLYLELGCL